jgi:hypothetical protein
MEERPTMQVIVVVDASFGYRIEESERSEFEQAEAAGEIVSPPAGALGRGDGFLLKIADRTGAAVLSNDSFQEFHGEYPWLFDDGRLYGGKPVPGVGWIFTPRTPVRGPRSRESVRSARKAKKAAVKRATVGEGPVAEAIAEATAEAIDPEEEAAAEPGEGTSTAKAVPRRRRRSPACAPAPRQRCRVRRRRTRSCDRRYAAFRMCVGAPRGFACRRMLLRAGCPAHGGPT